MLPGVMRRAVSLDRVMITFFEFAPRAIVPVHDHPHEQISVVIEGAMEFQLGDEKRVLKAGEGACIPSGVKYGARILDRRGSTTLGAPRARIIGNRRRVLSFRPGRQ